MKTNKIKVAIVEDDVYFNRLITRYVSTICQDELQPNYEFQVKSYQSAHDFLYFLTKDLNFLILDYYLDTSNNPEVLNAEDIVGRVSRYCDNCKIILVSGLEDEEIIQKLLNWGIYDFVNKNAITANRVHGILRKIITQANEWPTKQAQPRA